MELISIAIEGFVDGIIILIGIVMVYCLVKNDKKK
jgi:hypothetical protein